MGQKAILEELGDLPDGEECKSGLGISSRCAQRLKNFMQIKTSISHRLLLL